MENDKVQVTGEVVKDDKTHVSNFAVSQAVKAWNTARTKHIVMDPILLAEFALIIDEYREALMWCSGSADFGPGGQAEAGFKKLCLRLITNLKGKEPSS